LATNLKEQAVGKGTSQLQKKKEHKRYSRRGGNFLKPYSCKTRWEGGKKKNQEEKNKKRSEFRELPEKRRTEAETRKSKQGKKNKKKKWGHATKKQNYPGLSKKRRDGKTKNRGG